MPRIAVLDDDPTGSQTVHDVAIVLALDDLRLAGDTTFFLTNTRSLPEAEAAALTERVARGADALAAEDRLVLEHQEASHTGLPAASRGLWTNRCEVDALPSQTCDEFADRLDRIGAGGG